MDKSLFTGPKASVALIKEHQLERMIEDRLVLSVFDDALVTQSFLKSFLLSTPCTHLVVVGGHALNYKECKGLALNYNMQVYSHNRKLPWWKKLLGITMKHKTVRWVEEESWL